MKITFHGAAGGVTGSKHLVEAEGKKILLDCGMFQGKRKESFLFNKTFPFNAANIDAVILSHAHIDHSGLLPMLIKHGFCGKIYTTPATADILGPMLLDSAHIQEMDAQYFMRKKHLRKTALHPIEPLYTSEDAQETLKIIEPRVRNIPFDIFPGITITFYNAGHVLGSSQVLLEAEGKKLGFTGDYGRKQRKIIKDPEPIPEADAFITESTYGGRYHPEFEETREELGKIIQKTAKRGGKIIIPSFALERSQEIIYDLHVLFHQNKIPEIPVYVDSPLTTKFTHIFEKNIHNFDEETQDFFLKKKKNPFCFSHLKHTVTTEESKRLNTLNGPCIIISASGMCEAGRIRHHLKNSISDERNTILIVGYQAKNTLGRKLVEKRKMVKIFDEMHTVRADINVLNGYSGHGDQKDLLENLKATKGLKKIFVVHGDPEQSAEFAQVLKHENPEWKIRIPSPGDTFGVE